MTTSLIRIRYNTKAAETPGGAFKWRVVHEVNGELREILAKAVVLHVPSCSWEEEMPGVGIKHHIACRGSLSISNDIAEITNETHR